MQKRRAVLFDGHPANKVFAFVLNLFHRADLISKMRRNGNGYKSGGYSFDPDTRTLKIVEKTSKYFGTYYENYLNEKTYQLHIKREGGADGEERLLLQKIDECEYPSNRR